MHQVNSTIFFWSCSSRRSWRVVNLKWVYRRYAVAPKKPSPMNAPCSNVPCTIIPLRIASGSSSTDMKHKYHWWCDFSDMVAKAPLVQHSTKHVRQIDWKFSKLLKTNQTCLWAFECLWLFKTWHLTAAYKTNCGQHPPRRHGLILELKARSSMCLA